MTVRELITKLENYPQDFIVWIFDHELMEDDFSKVLSNRKTIQICGD